MFLHVESLLEGQRQHFIKLGFILSSRTRSWLLAIENNKLDCPGPWEALLTIFQRSLGIQANRSIGNTLFQVSLHFRESHRLLNMENEEHQNSNRLATVAGLALALDGRRSHERMRVRERGK